VEVDLRKVSHLDTGAVAVLVQAHHMLAREGRALRVQSGPGIRDLVPPVGEGETMTTTVSSQELRVERLPDDFGPVLRFSGDLSAATEDTLHQDLAIASAEGAEREHASPAVTVNVSDCRFEEVEGVLALLDGARRLRRPFGRGHSGDRAVE
jgi:hypothetical protein